MLCLEWGLFMVASKTGAMCRRLFLAMGGNLPDARANKSKLTIYVKILENFAGPVHCSLY